MNCIITTKLEKRKECKNIYNVR